MARETTVEQTLEIAGAGEVDKIRDFLVSHGKISPDSTTPPDDRIRNIGMSCVELSLRPYDRRLLMRAIHDSQRMDALLVDREKDEDEPSDTSFVSPAEFRELITIVERQVNKPGDEGPVPAFFRIGAILVAAAYAWDQNRYLDSFHQVSRDFQASVRLLEDILTWVETGERGDRFTTLTEARGRFDELEARTRALQAETIAGIGRIETMLAEVRAEFSAGSQNDPGVALIGSQIESIRSELSGARQSMSSLVELKEALSNLDARFDALSDGTSRSGASLEASVMTLQETIDTMDYEDPREIEALEQLRVLALAGLVGVAIVAVLMIIVLATV